MEAPGRGALTGVPAIDRCESLVDYFQAELLPRLDRPFAFFGHSMGAMVAYSLACRLRSLGHPQPVWLGLSACGSPRAGGTGTLQSEQSDAELKEWLLRAGGTPPEVIRHPLLWRFLNPVLRSDLRVVDSWRPDTAAAALPCALSVFGGRDDAVVPPEQLAGWQPYGRDFFGVRLFGGGHSYLHENPEFVRQVTESIQLALR
jgi:surfactin synthase thioesterase subunit